MLLLKALSVLTQVELLKPVRNVLHRSPRHPLVNVARCKHTNVNVPEP